MNFLLILKLRIGLDRMHKGSSSNEMLTHVKNLLCVNIPMGLVHRVLNPILTLKIGKVRTISSLFVVSLF